MNNSDFLKDNQFDTDRLVDKIRVRTGMYTGGNSLEHLKLFLGGINYVLHEIKIESSGVIGSEYFDIWLEDKYHFGNSCAGWANIITAISLGYKSSTEIGSWSEFNNNISEDDHIKARKLFFQLFDECRASISKGVGSIPASKGSIKGGRLDR